MCDLSWLLTEAVAYFPFPSPSLVFTAWLLMSFRFFFFVVVVFMILWLADMIDDGRAVSTQTGGISYGQRDFEISSSATTVQQQWIKYSSVWSWSNCNWSTHNKAVWWSKRPRVIYSKSHPPDTWIPAFVTRETTRQPKEEKSKTRVYSYFNGFFCLGPLDVFVKPFMIKMDFKNKDQHSWNPYN